MGLNAKTEFIWLYNTHRRAGGWWWLRRSFRKRMNELSINNRALSYAQLICIWRILYSAIIHKTFVWQCIDPHTITAAVAAAAALKFTIRADDNKVVRERIRWMNFAIFGFSRVGRWNDENFELCNITWLSKGSAWFWEYAEFSDLKYFCTFRLNLARLQPPIPIHHTKRMPAI